MRLHAATNTMLPSLQVWWDSFATWVLHRHRSAFQYELLLFDRNHISGYHHILSKGTASRQNKMPPPHAIPPTTTTIQYQDPHNPQHDQWDCMPLPIPCTHPFKFGGIHLQLEFYIAAVWIGGRWWTAAVVLMVIYAAGMDMTAMRAHHAGRQWSWWRLEVMDVGVGGKQFVHGLEQQRRSVIINVVIAVSIGRQKEAMGRNGKRITILQLKRWWLGVWVCRIRRGQDGWSCLVIPWLNTSHQSSSKRLQ